jgi:hypothetical protein
MNTASGTEWVTKTPAKASRRKSPPTSSLSRWRVISSSAPKGSSNRNSSGRRVSARAMEARIRIPPESWAGLCFSNPARPTRSMASSAAARRSVRSTPASSAGSSTLRSTVRHGSRVASWKTYPSCPAATSTAPELASSNPAASRSRVDFPQPDGPTRETNSPGRTVMSISRSAAVPFSKTIDTFRNASAGSGSVVYVAGPAGVGAEIAFVLMEQFYRRRIADRGRRDYTPVSYTISRPIVRRGPPPGRP